MAQRYPDDHEVRLFYALSILGAGAGVRDIPNYMEATALSQSLFYSNRQHPGAAHYFIHGVDDPVHAPLGLEAARALAAMAPDAGHSLHMASHIFVALGRWNDVVNANTRAVQVENAMAMELGQRPRHWGHYNFWLLYGLLQQGRERRHGNGPLDPRPGQLATRLGCADVGAIHDRDPRRRRRNRRLEVRHGRSRPAPGATRTP